MNKRSLQTIIDWRSKGLPASVGPVSHNTISDLGWSLTNEDLMLPVAVLRQMALTHNSDWMRRFTELANVKIAPHGKTTMSKELFALQMADGAWGMTAATTGHVRIYRDFGIQRIMLANQLIGKQSIAYIVQELARDPDFDFYCLADSHTCIDLLEEALAKSPPARPIQLLLELGYAGGRSGMRDDSEALALARRIAASPVVSLRGIEAFEGIVQGQSNDEAQVSGLLDRMVDCATQIHAEDLFSGQPILSAGGSSFFDLVANKGAQLIRSANFEVVLRSGCYLVHDSHFYRDLIERLLTRSPEAASLGEGLKPALQLWAYVHSRPEPTRLIVALGKRDTSDDVEMPVPLNWYRPGTPSEIKSLEGHKTVRLDDQHAYLDVPTESPLQPGDMIAFGISHPCTTFDKWRTIFIVDESLKVVDFIETNF